MRHQNSGRKLKRTHSHRKATLAALCTALIVHKRIKTTVAKAKETRMFVEKIITRAKNAVATESAPDKKDVSARREKSASKTKKNADVTTASETPEKAVKNTPENNAGSPPVVTE